MPETVIFRISMIDCRKQKMSGCKLDDNGCLLGCEVACTAINDSWYCHITCSSDVITH